LIQPDGSGGGSLARRQVCSIAVRPGVGTARRPQLDVCRGL